MSDIVILNLGMPESCNDCVINKPLKLNPDECLVHGCRFKSLDGLIEKLEEARYTDTTHISRNANSSGLGRAIEIIKDYCGLDTDNTHSTEDTITDNDSQLNKVQEMRLRDILILIQSDNIEVWVGMGDYHKRYGINRVDDDMLDYVVKSVETQVDALCGMVKFIIKVKRDRDSDKDK